MKYYDQGYIFLKILSFSTSFPTPFFSSLLLCPFDSSLTLYNSLGKKEKNIWGTFTTRTLGCSASWSPNWLIPCMCRMPGSSCSETPLSRGHSSGDFMIQEQGQESVKEYDVAGISIALLASQKAGTRPLGPSLAPWEGPCLNHCLKWPRTWVFSVCPSPVGACHLEWPGDWCVHPGAHPPGWLTLSLP